MFFAEELHFDKHSLQFYETQLVSLIYPIKWMNK